MQSAQTNMIKQQLRPTSVVNEDIIHLFEVLPREKFVPAHYANFAYSDMQIPLPHGQRMFTPTEEGQILQALKLKNHETVLEIGTGFGYLTAMLSKLAKKVISLDIFPEFTKHAQTKLKELNIKNVSLYTANGYEGFPQNSPYDCIIVTGATTSIPDELLLQLATQGRLFALIGQETVQQAQIHKINAHQIRNVRFLFN